MSIDALTKIIAGGQPADINRDTLAEQTKQAIDGLFGARYQARSRYSVRVALMPGADAVSFAGLVHEDSPTSGVYGGMSLIWFPVLYQKAIEPCLESRSDHILVHETEGVILDGCLLTPFNS